MHYHYISATPPFYDDPAPSAPSPLTRLSQCCLSSLIAYVAITTSLMPAVAFRSAVTTPSHWQALEPVA